MMPMHRQWRVSWLVILAACSAEQVKPRADSATKSHVVAANLLDTAQTLAVAGEQGWNYQQTAGADLDGDGTAEHVVLTARVEVLRGRPLWDDGQPWQLYVESADKKRTYMYARFVQLGTLTMRLTAPDSGKSPRIILLEQLPDRLAVYEGTYRGVGKLTSTVAYEQMLDSRGEIAEPAQP